MSKKIVIESENYWDIELEIDENNGICLSQAGDDIYFGYSEIDYLIAALTELKKE